MLDETSGKGKVPEKVTENKTKILELIKKNKFITVIKISNSINISRKSVLESPLKATDKKFQSIN